jgi:hypothetical protein
MRPGGNAGNGDWGTTERQPHGADALAGHGRQIRHDAEALVATLRDTTDGVQRYLIKQVEQRPLRTLGMAAGVGYLLGGGLSSRLTVFLLGAGVRVATAVVARELADRILQSSSTWANKSFRGDLGSRKGEDHAD